MKLVAAACTDAATGDDDTTLLHFHHWHMFKLSLPNSCSKFWERLEQFGVTATCSFFEQLKRAIESVGSMQLSLDVSS